MSERPNIIFLLTDQLRAQELPIYGGTQIATPNLNRLAQEGVTFSNAVSPCPVCTPYRSMLVTGRHPQSTGHVINFIRTRHDEISIGDAFSHAGYRTGWIGKWHLHTGVFPQTDGPDYVPEGRDRLGFKYWRGYNFHADYFNGTVNLDNWRWERWNGYETEALNRYAFEFMDNAGEDPFLLFISPHQPHFTPFKWAPDSCYARVPEYPDFPANVPDKLKVKMREHYRHYLAMILAVDDMVGGLLDYIERTGRAGSTFFIFSSDHGTQMGGHGNPDSFAKKQPYEESIHVPLIARIPGVFEGGGDCDTLVSPVDIFPTLCSLCGVPIPDTVEGRNFSPERKGSAAERDAVLLMNFTDTYDYLTEGQEWRGVRTKKYMYARWLNGRKVLYDLDHDPLERNNLSGDPACRALVQEMESVMREMMSEINDELVPCSAYESWFDSQRRVIRNARGPLGSPEQEPDWSRLGND